MLVARRANSTSGGLLADRQRSPCFGCTEKTVGFRIPLFQRVTYTRDSADTYAPISGSFGKFGAAAAGLVG